MTIQREKDDITGCGQTVPALDSIHDGQGLWKKDAPDCSGASRHALLAP